MKQFVEIIVRGLVSDPEAVSIEELSTGRGVTYEVRVAEEDRGNVIGRRGATASAVRTLVSGLAPRDGGRVDIHILD